MQQDSRKHLATLTKRKLVAQDTYELTFSVQNEFSFLVGQYVWVEMEKLVFEDVKGNRRAFSICSSPNKDNTISIVFRESSSGYKKTLLAMPLQSQVNIYGPFGSLVLPTEQNIPIIFIAGGVGIAPFRSIIHKSIIDGSVQTIHLIYANPNLERAAYIEELRQISKNHTSFILQEIYEKITIQHFQKIPQIKNSIIYTTGPAEMVDAVGTILTQIDIPKNNTHFEEFYPKQFAPINSLFTTDFPVTENLFSLSFQNTSNHIVLTDINGKIIFANKAAELLTGYSFEEMRGQTSRLWGGLMDKAFYATLWETIKIKQKPFTAKIYNRKKKGVVYVAIMRISPIFKKEGKLTGFMATEEDITELENLNDTKTEFVVLAAHQLRTPLTVIRWNIETLLVDILEKGELNPLQRKSLDEIYTETKHMISLTSKFLSISRLQMGKYTIKLESTDPLLITKKVLLDLKNLAEEKKLIIKELYAKNVLAVYTDPDFIQIILENLISNAIKYSNLGGNIEIEISLDKQKDIPEVYAIKEKNIFIRVSDTGIGIPKQNQAGIFQGFSRAENAKKIDTTGFGFGLYMTKLIVEHSNGKIWFESEENKGTTFYILLPVQ